jgi:glyceraldehyde 3-phosphate dehydrogenase (phosphorylating)
MRTRQRQQAPNGKDERMALKAGINGFGRIGRNVFRAAHARGADIDWVGVNDITDTRTLAHLLRYDSILGPFPGEVEATDRSLVVDGKELRVFSERDPAALPWADTGAEVVIESTGLFTKRADAAKHLDAGARKVIISAPATEPDVTIALGVNDDAYDPERHHVISNASCTTNCVAPIFAVLDEVFGVEGGWVDTVHAFTNDQQLLDLPHHDLRRSRAAGQNIVPTGTGADRALSLVLPHLKDKVHSVAVRVPVPDGSLSNAVCMLSALATTEQVRQAFVEAAESERWSGLVGVSDMPMVSTDVLGDPRSCVVSLQDIESHGSAVRVFGWYDNEWGYANRLLDLIEMVTLRTNVRRTPLDLATSRSALIG